MLTESVVVILLTLIISYLYMRRGKRGMSMSVLPLAVLPIMNIIGYFIGTGLPTTALLSPKQWQVLFLMIGLIAGGSLFGIISSNIKKRSARRAYLVLCGGFTVLFAFAGIMEYLHM
ncbi:MAG: hypothetical protein RSF82_07825 [Angelakisella sp.]